MPSQKKILNISSVLNNTGEFVYFGDIFECVWERDSEDSVMVELDNGQFIYLQIYSDKKDGDSTTWMVMQVNEKIVWLY